MSHGFPSRVFLVGALVLAFTLGALLPGAFGDSRASPTVVRNAWAQTGAVWGAPDRALVLSRVVVDPGAKIALHHHLGTQVARIASGTLTYTVRKGSAVVWKGDSDREPSPVVTLLPRQTARIRAGQWLAEQPSDIHEASNRGNTPVVIYIATLLKSGAPPSTPVTLPGG